METNASIARLFGFDAKTSPQPRFAKVASVSADTLGVLIGTEEAEAVRCCVAEVGDIVLVQTMPNGTLAAIAKRGETASASATWGSITGDLGDQTDLAAVLATIPSVTTNSGGTTFAECMAWPVNGWGWKEEKHSDGRLIVTVWDWFSTATNPRYATIAYPAGATAFVDTPTPTVGTRVAVNCSVSVSVGNISSSTIGIGTNRVGNSGNVAVVVRLEGRWK